MARKSPSSTRYAALIQLLRTADAIWDASRVFFDQWNVSPSQFNILNLLDSHPEGLSQSDLGRQLITHRSNLTGLVDRLEKRGLVRRAQAAGDRRAYRVVLTKDGTSLLQEILPLYFGKAERVWDGVPRERISEVLAATAQVARNATALFRASSSKIPVEDRG